MNRLVVGTNKSDILQNLPKRFLIIDDGELIDALPDLNATVLDLDHHTFNPLRHMNAQRADEFVAVLDAVFPQGQNTLTARYSNHLIFKALLEKPERLDKLVSDFKDTKDPYERDAYQKIEWVLLHPVLERVLNRASNLSFTVRRQGKRDAPATIIARLNRAELGDRVAFILANFLIAQYRGPVVIPDFGFYGRAHHTALIRENRLTAGLNFLDETSLRNELLLIKKKTGRSCTADDAATLASFTKLLPGTNEYNDFIADRVA